MILSKASKSDPIVILGKASLHVARKKCFGFHVRSGESWRPSKISFFHFSIISILPFSTQALKSHMIGAFCFLDWQVFQPALSVLVLNKFLGHFTYPPQPEISNFNIMMHEPRAFQMVVGPMNWKATCH